MKKVVLFVLILLALSIAVQGQESPVRTDYHAQTGMLSFIGANPSHPIAVRGSSILDTYAPQFGTTPQELTLSSQKTVDQRVISRYQQTYQGVPVFGGNLVVQTTAAGDLIAMIGEASPFLNIGVVPQVATISAQQTALGKVARDYGYNVSTLGASQPELWIYDARLIEDRVKPVALVWKLEVTSSAAPDLRELVLVNAQTGGVELSFNQIDSHWKHAQNNVAPASLPLTLPAAAGPRVPGTADLSTHDANNADYTVPGALPGVFLCDETDMTCTNGADTDADAAHIFAKAVYDFYWTRHGRDSLNAAGMQLISSVHVNDFGDVPMCNAFWNGEQMGYGDDCGSTIVLDDVVGHELTHGVTTNESNLVYAYQSGAINESLSDVWGELFDLTNATAEDIPANRWAVGEELGGGGIRDMQDPTIFGDPDRMLSPNYYTGTGDSGGVHTNSGVNNKATYLLVDGATFNGHTVTPIGIDKTLAVYYEAQTKLLFPAANYGDLRNALLQACATLASTGASGITTADCTQVDNATLATEMNTVTPTPPAPSAAICPTGELQQTVLFADGLEAGSGNWTTEGTASIWNTQFPGTSQVSPINGTFSLFGIDLDSPSDAWVKMTNAVTLPAGASYLHFKHQFNIEEEWDGSVVDYTTNGTTWNRVTTAPFFDEGIDYTGTILNAAGTALSNQPAFTGYMGLGSTRYDLSSLAGQNVRFRFRIVSDAFVGEGGWLVDDVQIYTCAVPVPGVTVSKTNAAVTEGGAGDSYTIVLNAPPSQDVNITVTNASADVSADKATLTFKSSDWNVAQTVTLTAVNDTEVEGAENATITHTAASSDGGYNGIAVASVNVAITDNDTATPTTVELLTNGGFETKRTDSPNQPTNWEGKGLSKDKLACNLDGNVVAHTGECAFRFKGSALENAKLMQAASNISGVTGGVVLNTSMYYKTNAATPRVKVKLLVFYQGQTLPVATKRVINTVSSTYTEFSLNDYTVASTAPVTMVKIKLQNKALSGKTFIDDVSVSYTAVR